MKKVFSVDKGLFPDCCMCCKNLYIDNGCMCCDLDGFDVLPYNCCLDFKRLKSYISKEDIDITE